MSMLIKPKFVESEGYWFNVIQIGEEKFAVENTKRRRDQITRDGLGYTVKSFDAMEDALNFLDSLK